MWFFTFLGFCLTLLHLQYKVFKWSAKTLRLLTDRFSTSLASFLIFSTAPWSVTGIPSSNKKVKHSQFFRYSVTFFKSLILIWSFEPTNSSKQAFPLLLPSMQLPTSLVIEPILVMKLMQRRLQVDEVVFDDWSMHCFTKIIHQIFLRNFIPSTCKVSRISAFCNHKLSYDILYTVWSSILFIQIFKQTNFFVFFALLMHESIFIRK